MLFFVEGGKPDSEEGRESTTNSTDPQMTKAQRAVSIGHPQIKKVSCQRPESSCLNRKLDLY